MLAAKLLLKSFLGWSLFSTGLYRPLLRNRAVVVTFHRVDDRLKGNPLSCTRREFEAYCKFFQRHFEVIGLSELLRRLRDRASVARALVITFDDGYLDNYEVAAPVLLELGLPACFFLSTNFIGSETRPWWDVEYGAPSRWMTWDQVRCLWGRGFEIGAHTMNHVDLGAVDQTVARCEIAGSLQRLRDEGISAHTFSFPYGREKNITEQNREVVRTAQLSCCLSCFGGTVAPGDDPYSLRRTPVSPWFVSPFHFGFELISST